MFIKKFRDNGFTLFEIMVVMFLFSIILTAIFSVLATGRISFSSADSQLTVQQEARRGLNVMIKELRQAGVSTIGGLPADGVSRASITFKIPTAIALGGITWSGDIQYSLGGLNGRQLLRTESTNQRVLANNVLTLNFSRGNITPDIVNITIIVQKNTFPGFSARQSNITLTSRVKVRNL